jgi:TolB-like protein/class 3 adenylate cyclase/Tfp pilus assembly protein PilF
MNKTRPKYKYHPRPSELEEHHLAAIMFTDIVGFTELMGKNEHMALQILEKNRDIQKSLVKKYNGLILKEMGDGMLVSFYSTNDSVICAREILNAIRHESELSLRIGIHEGDIVFKDNDVFGDGVNIAFRIQEEARKDSVYISESVYNDIRNKPEVVVEFVEEKILKNVNHPLKIYAIVDEQICIEPSIDNIVRKFGANKISILVLPFQNISQEANQEYFSDGLTEEIITDLSQIRDFLVISRSSSMAYKGTIKNVKTIAQEVNVQYVLEGSVRKSGNNLRITAQLIDASSDTHIWADKYNGTLEDVFDIQEKVSRSIVEALETKLNPIEKTKLSERSIENPKALECLFKAKEEMFKMSEAGLMNSLTELQKGLKITGDNARFFASIGLIYFYYYKTGINTGSEPLQKVEEYAYKVLKLEPNSSTAYFLLGVVERYHGNSINATKYFKRALEIDSFSIDSLLYLSGIYALQMGKPSSAEPFISKVLEIDPMNPVNYIFLGFVQWMEDKLDYALSSFQKSDNLDPGNIYSKFWYIYGLAWKGQHEQAVELIDQIAIDQTNSKKDSIFNNWCLFFKNVLLGRKSEALAVLEEDTKNYFWNDPELLWLGVCNFTLIDEKEEALDWLERAINWGWINYPLFAEKDPFFKDIRGETRFIKLIKKVKNEWDSIEI